MKIYDISQELLSCVVFPGDTAPALQAVKRTEKGDLINLSDLTLCVHNGTHLDAPFHFLGNGKTVAELDLAKTVGYCYLAEMSGALTAEDAVALLARISDPEAKKRILIKGEIVVTPDFARVLVESGVELFGVECQSAAPMDAPMEVHLLFLSQEVVLLEGLRLGAVLEGVYFLSAAPLSIQGCDGSPCRAILIEV